MDLNDPNTITQSNMLQAIRQLAEQNKVLRKVNQTQEVQIKQLSYRPRKLKGIFKTAWEACETSSTEEQHLDSKKIYTFGKQVCYGVRQNSIKINLLVFELSKNWIINSATLKGNPQLLQKQEFVAVPKEELHKLQGLLLEDISTSIKKGYLEKISNPKTSVPRIPKELQIRDLASLPEPPQWQIVDPKVHPKGKSGK